MVILIGFFRIIIKFLLIVFTGVMVIQFSEVIATKNADFLLEIWTNVLAPLVGSIIYLVSVITFPIVLLALTYNSHMENKLKKNKKEI